MMALVVGIVVVSILDDHGTTVTGLADTLVEIMDDGKFRFTNGWKINSAVKSKLGKSVAHKVNILCFVSYISRIWCACIIGYLHYRGY